MPGALRPALAGLRSMDPCNERPCHSTPRRSCASRAARGALSIPLEIFPFFRRWSVQRRRGTPLHASIWNSLLGVRVLRHGLLIERRELAVTWRRLWTSTCLIVRQLHRLHASTALVPHRRPALGHRRARRAARRPTVATVGYYTRLVHARGVFSRLRDVASSSFVGSESLQLDPAAALRSRDRPSTSVISVVLIASSFFWRERQRARRRRTLERERERIERIEREAALANLRALQAQIEPHFLFNTLANVTSLDRPRSRHGQAHARELHPLPARLARRHAHASRPRSAPRPS